MEKFISKILACSPSEVEQVVNDYIDELQRNSSDQRLGLSIGSISKKPHRGFISLGSTIKYTTDVLVGEVDSYSMNERDYLIDFCKYVNKYQIRTKNNFINFLVSFMDWYFGPLLSEDDLRKAYLSSLVRCDDDGFPLDEDVSKLTIGNFKRMGIAQCTEKAAATQNILSLFGFDSYYCSGEINTGEGIINHAFNIVKNGDGYVVLDTSMPVIKYENGKEILRIPYVSSRIPQQEINDILDGKGTISSTDYSIIDGKLVDDGKRMYGVNCALTVCEREHKTK